MARSRNIKPGFFLNDKLAEVEPLGRLLFAGLWTIADREGRLEDRPKKIKACVLPYDECNVDELLNQLSSRDFISRYNVWGNDYIEIVNWKKHQNPHIKEGASEIPAPVNFDASSVKEQDKHHTSTVQKQDLHETDPADSLNLIPDSLNLIPEYILFVEWFNEKFKTNYKPSTYKDKINTRLKEFTLDQLKQASLAMKADKHMMGINDNKKVYATIEYITRNEKNVDKWLVQVKPDIEPPQETPEEKARRERYDRLYGN